ncbi:hypothetical protein BVC80_1781g31 [Macleaya cordata]|uniref:Micronuclear linker histone polyprotein n=1 Tax=Macleaya cordata TaxID=56857 RepID=A0A200QTU8_MACCD|nr:hypothetical protein BVC80_1781g31 [Macleaya cordata]
MAMGGGGGGGSSKFSNSRGRPYAMMLLLAFGAAVFGVMVLHKFRERRIFNLLIKDKDRDIITLQLLLQKERDYSKEVKRKIEELKAKTYSLRTQKMEINNKLMDMQSTAASLREEGRALETELEEKRNEIKMLKEKERNSSQDNSQVAALTELLKQKETEIEEMKRRLENPIHVWSVSTDDPSNPPVNLSTAENSLNAKDHDLVNEKGEGGSVRESTDQNAIQGDRQLQKFENNQVDGEGSKERGENGEKNGEEGQVRGEVSGEKSESSKVEVLRMRGKEGNNNETEVVESSRDDDDALKTKDEIGDLKTEDVKEDGISRNQQVENFENSRYGEGRLLGMISKDGREMEVSDGSHNVESSGARGEDGDRSKTKDKRWRMISRNRELEKTGNSEEGLEELQKNESHQDHKTGFGMDDEVLRKESDNGDQAGLEGKEDAVVSNEEKLDTVENSGESEGFKVRDENGGKGGLYGRDQEETSTDGHQLLKPQNPLISGEDLGTEVTTAESNQLGMEGEMVPKVGQSEKPKDSQDVESVSDNFSRLATGDLEQKPHLVLTQPKEQEANGVQKPIPRELPRTNPMVLKRHRMPKVTKSRKTWKSTVRANNPES